MAMKLEEQFGTDPALEAEGVWIDLGHGARLKIRATSPANPAFTRAAEKHMRAHRNQQNIPVEVQQKALNKIYAESVIADWEGIEFDGAVQPFSVENARRMLDKFPRMFAVIQGHADSVATFQADTFEADSGN